MKSLFFFSSSSSLSCPWLLSALLFFYLSFAFILAPSLYLSCPWLSSLALCSVGSYYHPRFDNRLPSLLYIYIQPALLTVSALCTCTKGVYLYVRAYV